jgi:NACalpha-BTF3-like transcription factor
MALLIELYEVLKETAGEEKAKKAIESLEEHIKENKEEQATKDDIKLLIEQMNLRFEEVNRRFEEIDRRFEVVEKRLNFIQWFIALGFTLITVIMTLYRFFG